MPPYIKRVHHRYISLLSVMGLLFCIASLTCPATGNADISGNDGVMEPFSLSVYNTGVGVGTDSKGYVEVFIRNGVLYQNSQLASGGLPLLGYFDPTVWTPLINPFVTPYMASDPVVAKDEDGMLDVFFIGPDGAPWHQYQIGYDDNGNSTWTLLPSSLVPVELPSAGSIPFSNVTVALAKGILHVYYIGADGAIWEITQTAAGDDDDWNAPVSLGTGGTPTGHPTAIVNGGVITVFYRSDEADPTTGNRGLIYSLTNDGTPTKITGPVISSDVTPIANSDGRLELFYRGSEDGLWHIWQTSPGGPWSTPRQLSETGGTVTSDPAAIINATGMIQIFYRGTEGDIWTVVRDVDNQDAGEWSCRANLMNSLANNTDILASPISIAVNQKNDNKALQLFFVGGRNTAMSGNVARAAIDNGQRDATSIAPVPSSTFNDVWTLVQTSANSNPDCSKNDISGWTIPTTIGGDMEESMPPFDPIAPDQ